MNHTGHTIEIRDGKCDQWLQVGLSGPHIHFRVLSLLVGCASVELRKGTTRFPVTIPTTYTRCAQGEQRGTEDLPHCVGPDDSRMPPLPPGTYRAQVGTQHTATAPTLPKAVDVILQPA